jgi:hypothetical protein
MASYMGDATTTPAVSAATYESTFKTQGLDASLSQLQKQVLNLKLYVGFTLTKGPDAFDTEIAGGINLRQSLAAGMYDAFMNVYGSTALSDAQAQVLNTIKGYIDDINNKTKTIESWKVKPLQIPTKMIDPLTGKAIPIPPEMYSPEARKALGLSTGPSVGTLALIAIGGIAAYFALK